MSTTAHLSTTSPKAQELSTIYSQPSDIFNRTAPRDELFMRLSKIPEQKHERDLAQLPDVLRAANRYGRAHPLEFPSTRTGDLARLREGQISSSGLFVTPPSSPIDPPAPTRMPKPPNMQRTTRSSPHSRPSPPSSVRHHKYQPYRRTSDLPEPSPPLTRTENFDLFFTFTKPLSLKLVPEVSLASLGAGSHGTSENAESQSLHHHLSRRFPFAVDAADDRDVMTVSTIPKREPRSTQAL